MKRKTTFSVFPFFSVVSVVFHASRQILLQLKRGTEHDGASAEAVVVAVGVDAVEDGVGVVALVQEIVKLKTEDKSLPFVLSRSVEE